ncbi:MAG: dihydroorotate dehydrogenase electron transfer subunit [Clostridiales bacterium]|nr:dihydroorotate dehydrogenase electron transfer subunit [Clostridiales bacterium]
MAKRIPNCRITSNELVADDTYLMQFECVTKNATPGQFVHLRVTGRDDLILRRPISINSIDTKNNIIKLIIQAKGEGTKALCVLKAGDVMDIISPTGRGYMLSKKVKKAAVIGGGIGVAPLKYLIEYYKNVEFDSYLGFRSDCYAYQLDEFKALSNKLYVCTDDGTYGEKGFVTNRLDMNLEKEQYDVVLACGPKPMLGSLKKVIDKHKVPCFVSLEERMGCGIGLCKVCVCKTQEDGEENYERVCLDGPVFDINKVVL